MEANSVELVIIYTPLRVVMSIIVRVIIWFMGFFLKSILGRKVKLIFAVFAQRGGSEVNSIMLEISLS